MIWDWMTLKESAEISIIATTINTHGYIEMLDSILIPSIESWLGDDEVIFQYANASILQSKKD